MMNGEGDLIVGNFVLANTMENQNRVRSPKSERGYFRSL